MACNIPNFNFAVKVIYDLTTTTPTVEIQQLSTGANLANIDYFFVLYTPSGVAYHTGSFASPDASGVWSTINISENIPQSGGHIEFSNLPYKILGYAKDNSGNICEIEILDILCAPTGNTNKNNYGAIYLSIKQLCSKGVLEIIDTSNYLYQGVAGSLVSNDTTFVYPTDEGTPIANATTSNKNAFTLPIPINSPGHELYRNSYINYTLSSGNQVNLKYKYAKKDLSIDCNISMCSILCGLTKYRQSFTGANGVCSEEDTTAIFNMTLKVAQLSLALNYMDCGFDVYTLNQEIKTELLANDCYCDCNDNQGNNTTTALKCSDIDIECVWNEINNLFNSNIVAKGQLCTLVASCVAAQNAGVCSQVFISGVLFTETVITINFNLANTTNSNALLVYYKNHASGTWILADTIASNVVTYDITGTFTPGDSYDIKITNDCNAGGSGGITDSSIVTGIITQSLTSCFYLDTIYAGLANGMYVVEVNSALTGCNIVKPKLLNSGSISSLLPCPTPTDFKVSSAALLTWVGNPGDYQIFYKLKTDIAYTSFGINTYMGIENDQDLSSLGLTPLSDYIFKIRAVCNSGSLYSNPAFATYEDPSGQCASPGGFIGFNQTTGALTWAGNSNGTATYIVTAISGGASLGSPASTIITAIPFGTLITMDYASIAALISSTGLAAGDEILFSIQQDCGGGSLSDVVTYNYVIQGVLTPCTNTSLTFTTGTGGLVSLSIPSFPGNVGEVQYEVGPVYGGTFLPVLTGSTSLLVTSLYLPLVFNTGDTIRVRWRAKCSCCESDAVYSSWDTLDQLATSQNWDDVWKDIPNGWLQSGAASVEGAGVARYKLDRNGKLYLRGYINMNVTITSAATIDVNSNFLDISALASMINSSTDVASSLDYYPATSFPILVTGIQAVTGIVVRTNYMFSANYRIINGSGGTSSNTIKIPLSSISIQ